MIRPRGGRAAPRYYYYKKSGEDRLVKLMTKAKNKYNIEKIHIIINAYDKEIRKLIKIAKTKINL